MPSPRALTLAALATLAACTHAPRPQLATAPSRAAPVAVAPAPRAPGLCTEWRVQLEREFPSASSVASDLAVDAAGNPTIAISSDVTTDYTSPSFALIAHRWDGARWQAETVFTYGRHTAVSVTALPQPQGRTALTLFNEDGRRTFVGPPWSRVDAPALTASDAAPASPRAEPDIYRRELFGTDDGGARYELRTHYQRYRSPEYRLEITRDGAHPTSWPLPLYESRIVRASPSSPAPADPPADAWTDPVRAPLLVPASLRTADGPTVLALGTRIQLKPWAPYDCPSCSDDSRRGSGWSRELDRDRGELVVTALYESEPRMRTQPLPLRVWDWSPRSVRLDSRGRLHALLAENTDNHVSVPRFRTRYVLLGCGQ